MTANRTLDCDAFAAALADYLEDDASVGMRAAVESHAAGCTECRALLDDLGAITSEAAVLPALAPSRDLWAGIAERIDARVLPLERPAQKTIVVRRWWGRPAIAAAALVVVTAGVTHLVTRAQYAGDSARAVSEPSPVAAAAPALTPDADSIAPSQVASTPSVASAQSTPPRTASARSSTLASAGTTPSRPALRAASPAAQLASAVPVMQATQPVYDREIGELRRIVATRRSQLDPKTVAVLEQSIAVIDSAIAQSRAALAKDPASGFLATQLNHSLEKKVELLRTAALLPART
ncbi:MAG TPA: zf-HC2 domain-containing protein [Gemmatimonadaceae bacterium]|jgi:hypothetical protein|nr:zf-HC2 domain-containing protein [Gemmatimonadaceae bacterium]